MQLLFTALHEHPFTQNNLMPWCLSCICSCPFFCCWELV